MTTGGLGNTVEQHGGYISDNEQESGGTDYSYKKA